ncbi:hypothetical protein LBMAG53_29650 [Planctomycetota bacterium]|nr:hypothetical protein LBMAG53_29650 [Planctomycetota bacterium]
MPVRWRKQWISDDSFEAAGVVDVDGDGVLDIVCGGFWYQGPDFRRKHALCPVRAEGEYYDDFSAIFLDIDGDGRPDLVTGGWWGQALRWRKNPGQAGKPWVETVIAEVGNIETTRAWDLDGDGVVELVPNTPGRREVRAYRLRRDANGKGTGAFDEHLLFTFPEGQKQGHGLGCGDIAGHGRMDLVFATGWLEAPADPWTGTWIWHPAGWKLPWWAASVPMLVVDVNGDGVNDLIVGNAHGYGLSWIEQRRVPGGESQWILHPIDPFNAQYHDLAWADIDGDGIPELITGKRHRAHNGNDPGEFDDYGSYYFKWTGSGFAKQVIDYGPLGVGKGVGIHFALADLTGSGRLDLVAPGKDGLFVYFNLG